MQIVGIMLVRNEDRFVERALLNSLPFCDRMIVANHRSIDKTGTIVDRLCSQYSHLEHHHIVEGYQSHQLIQEYAGTKTWIFAVDGDEIYDLKRLLLFRSRLESGEFDSWWAIFGNVLNCVWLGQNFQKAKGYLAPPSRSMTKLYNFKGIFAWDGPCGERLHDGTISFKPGYNAELRLGLHEDSTWEASSFRCLHMCFLTRSSIERRQNNLTARPNLADYRSYGPMRSFVCRFMTKMGFGIKASPLKTKKYMRGNLVTKDVTDFFS